MSGPKAASKAGGGNGSSAIPAGDRKLVSSLKEVVPNSEEEIYAMLKECNRDPDETVQRLLSEGKFHVVKRKRDKKKETSNIKDASDSRLGSGSSGNFGRSGKSMGTSGGRGVGKATSLPRANTSEANGGRSKMTAAKENGIPPSIKGLSSAFGGSLSYSQLVEPKTSFTSHFNNALPSSGLPNGDLLQAATSLSLEGAWPMSSVSNTSTVLQGAWLAGSGHCTIADMLKSSGAHTAKSTASTSIRGNAIFTAAPATTSLELSVPSIYLAASDPVLSPSLDPCTRSPASVVKREIRAVVNQQFYGDRSTVALQDAFAHYEQANNSTLPFSVERHVDALPLQPTALPLSMPLEEQVQNLSAFLEGQNHLLETSEAGAGGLGSQFSTVPVYQAQQFVEIQKGSTGVDWSSQVMPHEEASAMEVSAHTVPDRVSSCPPSPSTEVGIFSATTAKLQELSVRDNLPVIIPDHIRVPEADCTMLSFGSFDAGFEVLPSSFITEKKSIPFPIAENVTENDSAVAGESTASSETSTTSTTILDQDQPGLSVSIQKLESTADGTALSNAMGINKEEAFEQTSQHPYPPSYSEINAVSSDHTGQYAAEDTESRPVLQPYDNSTYYSGVFRSGPEVDARYSAFLPSAATGKLGATNGQVTTIGQNAPSQEVANAMVFPSSNSVGGQTMLSVNNAPTAMSLPQQSLSIHPYATQPSGLPLGPFANVFSYQYMPPGFSYLQSPYQQHNYVGTGNYHQVPSAVGAAAMKYPVPQYKTGGTIVGGMHNAIAPSSLGYGGYTNSQHGTFPVNPPVTAGNTSSFDDAASQQYKETNVYIPSQQMEGPSVWLQTQLAREVQGSSYYNVSGQNQQMRYPQTQSLLAHAQPGAVYGNLYHPQQSGSRPSAHQLLQQQPALGSVGALGAQNGSYQQVQRAQQTWANGF